MPTTGTPTLAAISYTLAILAPVAAETAPPATELSCEKAKTEPPFTMPYPVTTPALSQPALAKASSSTKLPSSKSRSSRA